MVAYVQIRVLTACVMVPSVSTARNPRPVVLRILGICNNRPSKEKKFKFFRFVVERLEPTELLEVGKPRFPPREEEMTQDKLIA